MAPNKDPAHWLYRLSRDEWLASAETELLHCAATLNRRAFRPGVTHARRAAGMAWNAVLVVAFDDRYGRSYMEHIAALAKDDNVTAAAKHAAQYLVNTPPAPPQLITIGKPDLAPLDAARVVVDYARDRARATDSAAVPKTN
jgi:hypothetical protein